MGCGWFDDDEGEDGPGADVGEDTVVAGRRGSLALGRGSGAKNPFRLLCFPPRPAFAPPGGTFSFFTATFLSTVSSSSSRNFPACPESSLTKTSTRDRFEDRTGDKGGVTRKELGMGEEDRVCHDDDELPKSGEEARGRCRPYVRVALSLYLSARFPYSMTKRDELTVGVRATPYEPKKS